MRRYLVYCDVISETGRGKGGGGGGIALLGLMMAKMMGAAGIGGVGLLTMKVSGVLTMFTNIFIGTVVIV